MDNDIILEQTRARFLQDQLLEARNEFIKSMEESKAVTEELKAIAKELGPDATTDDVPPEVFEKISEKLTRFEDASKNIKEHRDAFVDHVSHMTPCDENVEFMEKMKNDHHDLMVAELMNDLDNL